MHPTTPADILTEGSRFFACPPPAADLILSGEPLGEAAPDSDSIIRRNPPAHS